MNLSQSQIEKIILEEVEEVLEENGILTERAGAFKTVYEFIKGFVMKRRKANKLGKLGSKGNKIGKGSGKLGKLGKQAEDSVIASFIYGMIEWMFVTPWSRLGLIGLSATVIFELVSDVAETFNSVYTSSERASVDTRFLSDRVKKEYSEFLEEAIKVVTVPEDPAWYQYGFQLIYAFTFSLPLKIILQVISGAIPILDLVGADPDILGWASDGWSESVQDQRKEYLDKISAVVSENGPIIYEHDSMLGFKEGRGAIKNENYNPSVMRSKIMEIVDQEIKSQLDLAVSQKVPYDPSGARPGIEQKLAEFIDALTNYDKAYVDDLKTTGDAPVSTSTKPSTQAKPASQAVPTGRKGAVPTGPVQRGPAIRKTKRLLKQNGVVSQDQIDAWMAWVTEISKTAGTEDRILEFLEDWLGMVRGAILEERKHLFTEIKLFVPKKGEFEFRNFIEWISKNNVSFGKGEQYGLYNIAWLEYVLRNVKKQAEEKRAFKKKALKMKDKVDKIQTQIEALEAQLDSEKDEKKRKKIEKRIVNLISKISTKEERGTSLRVSKKKLEGEPS